jgi:hypothetical protein
MKILNSREPKNVLLRTDLRKNILILNSCYIRTYQHTLTILYKHPNL